MRAKVSRPEKDRGGDDMRGRKRTSGEGAHGSGEDLTESDIEREVWRRHRKKRKGADGRGIDLSMVIRDR